MLLQKSVTAEDVIWCYRTFLGRDPESEAAVLPHLKHGSFKSLAQSFAGSEEYAAKQRPKHLTGSTQDSAQEQMSLTTPTHNDVLALAEYEAGVFKVHSTPRLLTLETSSRCNLRCVMCPHSINGVQRPKHMDTELMMRMEKFIRQASSIQLHGIGEPLASPAFWDSLQLIPESCDSSINTNMTVLDERRLGKLVASHLRAVNVSLDAARPETYLRIRGFSFTEVTNNIRRFVEARRVSGKTFPLLYMNMTLMRSNIEEVVEFLDLAKDIGANGVFLWHINRMPEEQMAAYKQEREGWLFDYSAEGLWNFPELSNEYLHKAEMHAKKIGMPLTLDQNKVLFYGEELNND
jgi:sulfatase maturation enzyme AslB (radical SAM superfamily)